jgi:hypothetical protein
VLNGRARSPRHHRAACRVAQAQHEIRRHRALSDGAAHAVSAEYFLLMPSHRMHDRQCVARLAHIVHAQYCRSMLDREQSGGEAGGQALVHRPPGNGAQRRLARPARHHGYAQRGDLWQAPEQAEIVVHGLAEAEPGSMVMRSRSMPAVSQAATRCFR